MLFKILLNCLKSVLYQFLRNSSWKELTYWCNKHKYPYIDNKNELLARITTLLKQRAHRLGVVNRFSTFKCWHQCRINILTSRHKLIWHKRNWSEWSRWKYMVKHQITYQWRKTTSAHIKAMYCITKSWQYFIAQTQDNYRNPSAARIRLSSLPLPMRSTSNQYANSFSSILSIYRIPRICTDVHFDLSSEVILIMRFSISFPNASELLSCATPSRQTAHHLFHTPLGCPLGPAQSQAGIHEMTRPRNMY
jgi:hypothetical protein